MELHQVDVQDGKGIIEIVVQDYTTSLRLKKYWYDCEKVFTERDEALEELAEMRKMIKENYYLVHFAVAGRRELP